jgi:hypothetical protein
LVGAGQKPDTGAAYDVLLGGRAAHDSKFREMRTIAPSDCVLMVDMSGKGHTTEVTSNGPVKAVMIRLAVK